MITPRKLAIFATAAAIVLLAFLIRSSGLEATGVGGNDTIYYYTLAEYWLAGERVFQIGNGVEVFRPVFLAYNELALKVFGHTPHAIKLANALVDTSSVVLVLCLTWVMFRRAQPALITGALYATLPLAIWTARVELAHALSTFIALLIYLALYFSITSKQAKLRLLFVACCGALIAAAALTHEDLIFLAPPCALTLLLADGRSKRLSIRSTGMALALLCVPACVALAFIWIGESTAVAATLNGSFSRAGSSQNFLLERFSRFSWNGIMASTSTVFALVVAASPLFLLRSLRRLIGDHSPFWVLFSLGTPLLFIFMSALFFGTFFARNFQPLLPLLLAGTVMILHISCSQMKRFGTGSFVAVSLVLGYSNLAAFDESQVSGRDFARQWAAPQWPTSVAFATSISKLRISSGYTPSYMTHWHRVFHAFKDRDINTQNRVLVMPSTTIYSPGRRPLQTEVYWGDNAIYRLDHPHLRLADLIADKNIRYVVFSQGQQRSPPGKVTLYRYERDWSEPETLDLAKAYGLNTYSTQAELEQLLDALRALQAKPIPLFEPFSYEARKAHLWEIP